VQKWRPASGAASESPVVAAFSADMDSPELLIEPEPWRLQIDLEEM
jgi:hypothetical protein